MIRDLKLRRGALGVVGGAAIVVLVGSQALALDQSVAAIKARPADLAAVGVAATGAGIHVGNVDDNIDLGHPTFSTIPLITVMDQTGGGLTVFDDHVTQSSSVIAGDGGPLGVAPGIAGLHVDKVFPGPNTGNAAMDTSIFYERVAQGVMREINRGSSVINLSLGGGTFAENGLSPISLFLDWAAVQHNVTFTVAIGNSGNNAPGKIGSNTISEPGDAYNIITVGATNTDFTRVASFSSEGRTDDLRNKPDIVAPGQNIDMAHSGWRDDDNVNYLLLDDDVDGQVGLNQARFNAFFGANVTFHQAAGGVGAMPALSVADTNADGRFTAADLVLAGPGQNYEDVDASGTISNGDRLFSATAFDAGDDIDADTIAANGTSFAAPHVAGAAALMQEFGMANGHSIDHKALKAIMLNTADHSILTKTGDAWKPTTPFFDTLDDEAGTGLLNVQSAFATYALGENTDLSQTTPVDWDINLVAAGGMIEYMINQPLMAGTTLAATLVWDRLINRTEAGDANTILDDLFNVASFSNLNLILVDPLGNELTNMNGAPLDGSGRAASSESVIDPTEHIFFDLPMNGFYKLRVKNEQGPDTTFAFSLLSTPVPEPATAMMLALGGGLLAMSRARGRRAAM